MRVFLKKCDLCIIGADAIVANGAVINKIGSSILASLAKELNKKLLVLTSLWKFDPLTIKGYLEPIEERSVKEIIGNKKFPKNVRIVNLAFDAISPEKIDVIITEAGVLTPQAIKEKFFTEIKVREDKFLEILERFRR
jgi:ribose 1,5-bisphosphate isomerase